VLAALAVKRLGLKVLGLHFVSPFFGKPDKVPHWREIYGLDIEPVDISEDFVDMLVCGPPHGLGKFLNPCLDCKILMLKKAKDLLPGYGAKFLISGEVLGQRPMSQRKDALDIITRDSQTRDILLRPLSAKNLAATPMEESGLVAREKLHGFKGRGRKSQLALAEEFKLSEIPTPAGGCLLAEKEIACKFWPVLRHVPSPTPGDFRLAQVGRHFWKDGILLVVGRNRSDNKRLWDVRRDNDLLFKVAEHPGPIGLARQFTDRPMPVESARAAAAATAWFSSKAKAAGGEVEVKVYCGDGYVPVNVVPGTPRDRGFIEYDWDLVLEEKKDLSGAGADIASA